MIDTLKQLGESIKETIALSFKLMSDFIMLEPIVTIPFSIYLCIECLLVYMNDTPIILRLFYKLKDALSEKKGKEVGQ